MSVMLLVLTTLLPVVNAFAYYDYNRDKDLSEVVIPSLDRVDEIDLDTVLKRSVEDSHNLQLLSLKLKYLGEKHIDLLTQYEDLSEGEAASVHLPTTPEEFMKDPNYIIPKPDVWMGPMAETNTVVNQVVYGIGETVGAINRIVADSRDKLNIGAHQVQAEEANTAFQKTASIEGVKLQETALYVQIVSLNKQIRLLEDYQGVIQKDLDAAKVMNESGISATEDIRTLEKALNKQKDDIRTARNNYNLALAQLAFDIGIEYNPSLKLADITDVDQGLFSRKNSEDLLAEASDMQIAKSNLAEALFEKDSTDLKNTFQQDSLYTNIDISKEKILQTRVDLSKKIENTYNDAQNAYDTVQTELRNNADTKTDVEKMTKRFEAGVISKHDLDKFSFKLRQSGTMLSIAKLKYYVLTKKISAMDKGFIQ